VRGIRGRGALCCFFWPLVNASAQSAPPDRTACADHGALPDFLHSDETYVSDQPARG